MSCQALDFMIDSKLRGLIGANLEDITLLSKADTSSRVLSITLAKVIVALGGGLTTGASSLQT